MDRPALIGVVVDYGTYANPDEYVASWSGWQLDCVRQLRESVLAAAQFEEAVKWGHLVYTHNGPVLLVRASHEWVRFGFWRGQRLIGIEPRLVPGGRYEMATIEFHNGDRIESEAVRKLALRAWELNEQLGDPRDAAKH